LTHATQPPTPDVDNARLGEAMFAVGRRGGAAQATVTWREQAERVLRQPQRNLVPAAMVDTATIGLDTPRAYQTGATAQFANGNQITFDVETNPVPFPDLDLAVAEDDGDDGDELDFWEPEMDDDEGGEA